MKLINIDYSVPERPCSFSSEALSSPIDQSVVGSVFVVDPHTNLLVDCLSQVLQSPNSPRNSVLLQYLQKREHDTPNHLSDDDLISLVRSRYASTPSELQDLSEHLQSVVRALNSSDVPSTPVGASSSGPDSPDDVSDESSN